MYFSVSPQAYLDSLEGNTNTNTVLETVPHGSPTFTLSINKENLAFWRNVLIVSTNKCLSLRSHWQTRLSGSFVGTAVPQLHQFPWTGMGWAAWEGFAASFQRTGFPLVLLISCVATQLSLGDLCLGIWGAQNIYLTCELMSSAFCLPAEVFWPFIFGIPVCWIPKTSISVHCCSCWRHSCCCQP